MGGSGAKRKGPSRAYRLKRKEEAAEGLRRIASVRAEKALARLRVVEGGKAGEVERAEAIHGARKDLKKLRAVVRLLRHRLDRDTYRRENRRYRDAGRTLAESRDAQVKLDTLDALQEHFDDLPSVAMAVWRRELAGELEAAEGGGNDAAIAQAVELIEAGRERIDDWDLGGRSWGLLDRGVTRVYRRGREAMHRAEAKPDAERLHEWRKRGKELWYLLRLLERSWPEVLVPTAEQAHRLTDCLGDHHDLVLLADDLAGRSIADELAPPSIAEATTAAIGHAIAARQEELAERAFEIGRRLYAEKPKAFRRRLKGYWGIWRG